MRINLFAGPGAGKSTTAAWLFSELKRKGYSIELVTEYIKSWATQKRIINEFDQVYLFGKQLQYEYRFLSNGIKNIVTDSPTLLSSIYANFYYQDIDISQSLEKINFEYDKKFQHINIFLERNNKPYTTQGRFQTLEQAKNLDFLIKKKLLEIYKENENLFFIDYQSPDLILEIILKHID